MLARKLLQKQRHGSKFSGKKYHWYVTGTAVSNMAYRPLFTGLWEISIRSIIGATEKRRESGAGVAVIGGIGGTESVWLGGGGVYQE